MGFPGYRHLGSYYSGPLAAFALAQPCRRYCMMAETPMLARLMVAHVGACAGANPRAGITDSRARFGLKHVFV